MEKETLAQTIGREVAEDAQVIKELVGAYRTGGREAAMKVLPKLIEEIRDDLPVVKEAVPAFKAGYKSTEFWLALLLVGGNTALFTLTGKALPIDVNLVLAAVVSVYTAVRGFIKAKQT
jgi:hypothetical protein